MNYQVEIANLCMNANKLTINVAKSCALVAIQEPKLPHKNQTSYGMVVE